MIDRGEESFVPIGDPEDGSSLYEWCCFTGTLVFATSFKIFMYKVREEHLNAVKATYYIECNYCIYIFSGWIGLHIADCLMHVFEKPCKEMAF